MENVFQVFLAHASENKNRVRNLRDKLLSDGIKSWLDEDNLEPGDRWQEVIPKEIANSKIFLACLSQEAIQKTGYIQRELRYALISFAERPQGDIYLIPVRLDNCEIPPMELPELGLRLRDFQYIDLWKENGYSRLISKIKECMAIYNRRQFEGAIDISNLKLERNQWEKLENAAREIATSAGQAAMKYYRNALMSSKRITESRNPSTDADQEATIAALQSLNSFQNIADDIGYNFRAFAEELDSPEVASIIKERLKGHIIYSKIKTSAEDFRNGWEHSISILIDAIDGTVNFDACLPFFCSAVAMFIGGRLSIGAIYDPFHNQIFFGSLRILDNGDNENIAKVWNVLNGSVEELADKCANRRKTKRNIISTHITRSDEDARNRFLQFLPKLLNQEKLLGGVYMLNCGQLALANVACGNLSAFLNNATGIWDVAAGEVLIRAVGGKVSDFTGRNIKYGNNSKISVIASNDMEIHKLLETQIRNHYSWN